MPTSLASQSAVPGEFKVNEKPHLLGIFQNDKHKWKDKKYLPYAL